MKILAQEENTLRRMFFEITQKYIDGHEIARECVLLVKFQRNLIEKMWRNEND